MQDSPNNRMVGQAGNVRTVGPHAHQWMVAGNVGVETYEVCEVCGTRRVRGALAGHAVQAAWIGGGEWVGDGLHPTAMPPSVLYGQAEYVDTHAEHEAQARAVDVVDGTQLGAGDVVKERRELEPGQLAEERGHPVAEPTAEPEPASEPAAEELEQPSEAEEPAGERKGRGRK
jgi:hypothetical protein